MASILEMMGHIDQQGEKGRQTGLSRLIGDAYRDPSKRQESLGRVAQFDGPAAFNAQAMFEKMDDTGRQRLGQRMAVFSALPDDIKAQAYPDIAREAQALGIPAPGEWNPEFAPHMQKIASVLTSGAQEMPTGFRQFQMTAEAAGLQPGSPEYQQAANIALGREGRASNAGFGFEKVRGMDGYERLQRRNPRTGAVEVYDESTGDFVPVGGMGAMGGAPPAERGGTTQVPSAQFATINGAQIPPEEMAAFQKALEADQRGEQYNIQIPTGGAPMVRTGANPSLVVGRRPEDEALATETAKQSVQTGFLPQQEAIKTQAAIQQATGIERGKAGVDREVDRRQKGVAYQVFDSGMAELERAMEATITNPLMGKLPAFTAAQQTADGAVASMAPVLKQLFRSAGEGVFTDKDQELLLRMLPTREDLPEARKAKMANLRRMVQAKLEQAGTGAPGGEPVRIKSAADYDRLPSGAVFIAPDGTQRKKR